MSVFYRVIRWITYVVGYIGFRPRISGKENLLPSGRMMLICNHIMWSDVVFLIFLNRRTVHFMAKEELFHNVLVGWVLRKVGAFPVKRGSADMASIKKAFEYLKQEEPVIIFPEGRRNNTEHVLPFRGGAAMIALKMRAPVVPVYIEPYHAFGRVNIHIGKAVPLHEYYEGKADLDAANVCLEAAITELAL